MLKHTFHIRFQFLMLAPNKTCKVRLQTSTQFWMHKVTKIMQCIQNLLGTNRSHTHTHTHTHQLILFLRNQNECRMMCRDCHMLWTVCIYSCSPFHTHRLILPVCKPDHFAEPRANWLDFNQNWPQGARQICLLHSSLVPRHFASKNCLHGGHNSDCTHLAHTVWTSKRPGPFPV